MDFWIPHARDFSWGRLSFLLLGILLSVGVFFLSGSYITCIIGQMKDFVILALMSFSILFGFSLTLMGIVGGIGPELAVFDKETLRAYEPTFKAKLLRQCVICVFYFLSILLALVLMIIPASNDTYIFLARIFMSSATFSVLLSFSMPYSLYQLYTERYQYLRKVNTKS